MPTEKKIVVTGSLGITDPSDDYATHTSLLGDGDKHLSTLAERNGIPKKRRQWTMSAGVFSDTSNNGLYILVRGLVNTDINDNANWFKILNQDFLPPTVGGGIGAPTIIAINDDTRSNVYEKVGPIWVYNGSVVTPTITNFDVVAFKDPAGNTMDIRVIQTDTGLVLAEKTGISSIVPTIHSLGTISNVPTDQQKLELQVKRFGNPGSTDCIMESIAITY